MAEKVVVKTGTYQCLNCCALWDSSEVRVDGCSLRRCPKCRGQARLINKRSKADFLAIRDAVVI